MNAAEEILIRLRISRLDLMLHRLCPSNLKMNFRQTLAFLFLAALAFSYSNPPHQEVADHNNAMAPSLLNSSCLQRNSPTYSDPIICAEAQLLTSYPSVDSRISSDSNTSVLWRYAYAASQEEEQTTITYNSGCPTTYSYHISLQRTEMYANLSGAFMGETYSSALGSDPIPIPVPLSELQKTDGSNITLNLTGSFIFEYTKDESVTYCAPVNGSCSCSNYFYSVPMNITRPISSSLSYEVEGGLVAHFLGKPVLREQWAQNSKIEDFAFSKRKFYLSSLELNGSQIGAAQIYDFSISNDSSDSWSIASNPIQNFSNLTMVEDDSRIIPAQVQGNGDFQNYIYKLDSNYYSPGVQNLTIHLSDEFDNQFQETFELSSRFLTFSNSTSEQGSSNISSQSLFRPSYFQPSQSISLLIAGLGPLGILIIAFLALKK